MRTITLSLTCILLICLFGIRDLSATVYNIPEQNNQGSLVNQRIKDELNTSSMPFVITPHKVNYFMPVTYNTSVNVKPFETNPRRAFKLDRFEAKFQISFKLPIWYRVFGDNGYLFFAYTNRSWWQDYNIALSAPFRDTNHEPELFMLFRNNLKIMGFTNSLWGFGAIHQSNGKSGRLSRSWNRLYANLVFDRERLAINTKIWWQIPNPSGEIAGIPVVDSNPDIGKFMGNFELTTVYGPGRHRFTFMLRNNLRNKNKGAIRLSWSYPILGNLRFYTEYFNGYGESLIDYNTHVQRIGVGFALNDLL